MKVYTVKKHGLNTDREYQAYVDLLQDIGIDIADVPRIPEPGTTNRWLYVWQSKPLAERFARELGRDCVTPRGSYTSSMCRRTNNRLSGDRLLP